MVTNMTCRTDTHLSLVSFQSGISYVPVTA
jgi:hypothetical protein